VTDIYVRVRLANADRTVEWRVIQAESISDAVRMAHGQEDVESVLEASLVPGGVVT
jgi:hypothetical protein